MKDLNVFLGLKKDVPRFTEFREDVRPYVCKKHGPVDAWHMQIPGFLKEIIVCPQCDNELRLQEAEVRARELAAKAADEAAAFEAALVKTGLPVKYRRLSKDSYTVRTEKEKTNRRYVFDYIDSFEPVGANWLVFRGLPGTGKSHAAGVIGCELFRKGYIVRYVRLTAMTSEIKDRYRTGTAQDYIRELSGADLLIVDEIGSAPLSEDDYRNVFNILDGRYADMKATILCTNAKNTAFFAAAIADRLAEVTAIVEFEGPSWRQAGYALAGRY